VPTVVPAPDDAKKFADVLVGVIRSSLSEVQRGLKLPFLLVLGLAIEEYPDELKFDSDVVLLPPPSPPPPHDVDLVMMEKGLR
jgi:hypothetical protein